MKTIERMTNPESSSMSLEERKEKILSQDTRKMLLKYFNNLAGENSNFKNDLDDLVQDTIFKAYEAAEDFNGDGSFNSWIHKIARNTFLDACRKLKIRPYNDLEKSVPLNGHSISDTDGSPLGEIDVLKIPDKMAPFEQSLIDHSSNKDRVNNILKLLRKSGKISEEDLELFLYQNYQGLSLEEISTETGMNVNTIKVKLFRVRKKVTQILKNSRN